MRKNFVTNCPAAMRALTHFRESFAIISLRGLTSVRYNCCCISSTVVWSSFVLICAVAAEARRFGSVYIHGICKAAVVSISGYYYTSKQSQYSIINRESAFIPLIIFQRNIA